MDRIEKILTKYGLTMTSADNPMVDTFEFSGEEPIELKEICRNKDGLILMEYNDGVNGSLLSIETVCELFPEHVNEIGINKNYLILYKNNIITE